MPKVKHDLPVCVKHKTYQGVRRPRSKCHTCWFIWELRQFEKHSMAACESLKRVGRLTVCPQGEF